MGARAGGRGGPEVLDGGGLAVVLPEDAGAPALVLGETRRRYPHRCSETAPLLHIGEELRQAADRLALVRSRLLPQGTRVAHIGIDRQDRACEWRESEAREHDRADSGAAQGDATAPRARPDFDRHRAGSPEHRVSRREVIGLGGGREHHGENGQVGDTEGTPRTKARRKEQPGETGDPHDGGKRSGLQNLLRHEVQRREHHILRLAGVRHELPRRPAMGALPEEMRREQQAREGAAEPEPAPAEDLEAARHHEADDQTEAEKEHADLVQQPEAGDRTEGEPEALVAAVEERHGEPAGERPEQQVEDVHRQHGGESEHDRREPGRQAGEGDRKVASPQPSGD